VLLDFLGYGPDPTVNIIFFKIGVSFLVIIFIYSCEICACMSILPLSKYFIQISLYQISYKHLFIYLISFSYKQLPPIKTLNNPRTLPFPIAFFNKNQMITTLPFSGSRFLVSSLSSLHGHRHLHCKSKCSRIYINQIHRLFLWYLVFLYSNI
jgi:hypothetical protein